MENWYFLSIIVLICQGIKGFLYKVSAEKNCNTAWTFFSWALTVFAFSMVFFLLSNETIDNAKLLFILGFGGAIAYTISTMSRMEAVKHAAMSVILPITRLNGVFVVMFSILYLVVFSCLLR